MWSLATLAFAGSAPDMVQELGERYPAAKFVVSCAPLSAVTGIARTVPLPPALSASEVPRLLAELSVEGAAATAGIDDSLGFTLVMHADAGLHELRLPFGGTVEQAGALVARLDPAATPAAAEATWELAVRGVPHRAQLHGGWLSVSNGETSATSGPPDPSPVLGGVADVPGCAVRVRDGRLGPSGSLHAFVPLAGGSAAIARLTLSESVPSTLQRTDAPIPSGRVLSPPSMVLTVSTPIGALLTELIARDDDQKLAGRDALVALSNDVRMPDGASLAFLGNPRKGGEWVGMTRLEGVHGPLRAKRVVKELVRAAGGPGVVRTGPRSLVVYGDDGAMHVQFHDDGRVALGSSPVVVMAALSDVGEPWLDDAGRAAARTSPILLRSVDAGMAVTVGLRPWSDRVIELFVDAKLPESQRVALQQNLGPMIGMMIPMLMMKGEGAPLDLPFGL